MKKLNFRRRNKDLAAIDGPRFNIDKMMTILSFVLLTIIVVIPIFMIIYHAFFYEGRFNPDLFKNQLLNKDNMYSTFNTLKIAFWVTFIGTIIGVFYAWLLGRSDIPAKGLMRALFNIPYMFPPFLGAMAWDLLLNGRSGYLNKWLMGIFNLQQAPVNINTLWGIIFVEVSYYFPFVFMQVVSALERIDPTLEESARIAGAKQLTVIRKITLPLVTPAISAGALLILISSLAHFGVPSILGFSQGIYTLPTMREVTTSVLLYGPYTRTLGVQIYSLRDAGMMPQAAALGSVAIVLIIICDTVVKQILKDRKGV